MKILVVTSLLVATMLGFAPSNQQHQECSIRTPQFEDMALIRAFKKFRLLVENETGRKIKKNQEVIEKWVWSVFLVFGTI